MTRVQHLHPSKKINKTGQIPTEIRMPYKPGGQKLKLLGI